MNASSQKKGGDVADRLHSVTIHLLRRLRRTDEATGVGPAQLSALSVLVFGGERTLGELASIEQVRPPTMTRIVKALEAAGLVRRKADPEDGRVSRIAATARGRKVLAKGKRLRLEALSALIDGLTKKQQAELKKAVEVLERLNAG